MWKCHRTYSSTWHCTVAPHFIQGMHYNLFNLVSVYQFGFFLTCLIWLQCVLHISTDFAGSFHWFSLLVSVVSYIGVWLTYHHLWGLCQCNLHTRSFHEHHFCNCLRLNISCIFILHGNVLLDDTFIQIYTIQWSYSTIPLCLFSTCPFCPLWSPGSFHVYHPF